MELLCASSNQSKLDDYRRIAAKLTAASGSDEAQHMTNTEYVMAFSEELFGYDINILGLEDMGLTEVKKNIMAEETGMSLYENAAIKARAAFAEFKRPVFADDSGNWINGIGGPAVFTGRYAEDHKNIKRCLEQMDTLHNSFGDHECHPRKMTTTTVICLITEDGKEHYFSGSLEGRISNELTKEYYDSIDATKPAWINVLHPHLTFYNEHTRAKFQGKVFDEHGVLSTPPLSAFKNAMELYDDICPRRIALLNMLYWIRKGGI